MDNFFDRTATVDSGDEEEEEFDEETGEPVDRPRKSKATNGDVDDSSEEEDDDDDVSIPVPFASFTLMLGVCTDCWLFITLGGRSASHSGRIHRR